MTVNPYYSDPAHFAVLIKALGDAPVALVSDFERKLSDNATTWRADLRAVPRGRDYAVLVAKYDQQLARSADHLSRVRDLLSEMQGAAKPADVASHETKGVGQNG